MVKEYVQGRTNQQPIRGRKLELGEKVVEKGVAGRQERLKPSRQWASASVWQ